MLKRRRNARCTAVAVSVLMNSRKQKILCCAVAILLSTDVAARHQESPLAVVFENLGHPLSNVMYIIHIPCTVQEIQTYEIESNFLITLYFGYKSSYKLENQRIVTDFLQGKRYFLFSKIFLTPSILSLFLLLYLLHCPYEGESTGS